MGQPVVRFEVVGSDGLTLAGFAAFSEVFGYDVEPGDPAIAGFVQVDELEIPEEVAFYVRTGRRSQRATAAVSKADRGARSAIPVRMSS